MYSQYNQFLSNQQDKHLYRKLFLNDINDKIDFSTNDYLNLSKNTSVIAAAKNAASLYGCGATGSRLLSGNYELIENFEQQIAKDKNSDNAIIFNSGFQTNYSVLSALTDPKILNSMPLIFMDKLCHASIYAGIQSHNNIPIRFKHNDANHLEYLLHKNQHTNNNKFIIIESLYGMDGDFTDIDHIAYLAEKYNAILYIDESHSTGVYGKNGHINLLQKKTNNVIYMGTFSKAIGCSGGYIACNKIIHEYIINYSKGFIYSTAPSPIIIAAAQEAWNLLPSLNQERISIKSLSDKLRMKLSDLSLPFLDSSSHIIPIILKKAELIIKVKNELQHNNIIVSAIKSPTVPANTCRLRVAINSNHTMLDINNLVEVLSSIKLH
jgi:8-amino-7-oxononanoate synthase